jgi:Bacterial SH3 domain
MTVKAGASRRGEEKRPGCSFRIALLGSAIIKPRVAVISILILAAAGYGYYRVIYRPRHPTVIETDYVISPSLDVLDTYAPVHTVVEVLRSGDRAEVLRRTRDWSEIRLPKGKTGWVLSSQLIGPNIFAEGKKILQRVSGEQEQAAGHASGMVNLHVEPSRQGALLTVLPRDQKIEMFDRKLVARGAGGEGPPNYGEESRALEAWYLVRTDSEPRRAGWVLGRLITLDIPAGISQYAQAYNMVAWRPLKEVEDSGRQVPEYVVADRVDTQDVDFNHIRVFTWSAKRHHYATAFVESGLDGEFPVTVGQTGGIPYFCLRLTDEKGKKFQKFYGLFDTVVRPVGIVQGWQNSAPPTEGGPGGARSVRGRG